MSDQARQLVELLNNPPFQKKYTLISFDGLSPLQLLQQTNDVFAEIAPDHKADIREEPPEDMVYRFLSLLRVLNYKPNMPATEFREGLVAGQQDVLYPMMLYCLTNLASLKKRAYLSNFLMTIDVPEEFLQNDDVAAAKEQYLELVEAFKEVHRDVEELKASGFSTDEIKNDLKHMKNEQQQLERRLARMRQKYEGMAAYNDMLDAVGSLREEMEREETLAAQRDAQLEQLSHAEDKLQQTMQALRDAKATAVTGGARGLIARVDEDRKAQLFLCQKLPKSIEEKRKACSEAKKVLDSPAMGRDDIDELHKRIQKLTAENNALVEQQLKANSGGDGQINMFRQQAAIISRKKENAAERLQELQDELASMQKELENARADLSAKGPRIPKADEFKRFVSKLRTKSTTYKAKKAQLAEIQAEFIVLDSTVRTLEERRRQAARNLSDEEAARGVSGVTEAQGQLEDVSVTKSELDAKKGATLDEISEMVDRLTVTINAKKSSLAPLIKSLRGLRTEKDTLKIKYDAAKAKYDKAAASLESSKATLESDVRVLREEVAVEEGRYHYLTNMMASIRSQMTRLDREKKIYVGQESGPSMRDKYTKKIQEQDTLGKQLRDRQKVLKETQDDSLRQLDLWKDVETLLQCKRECVARQQDRDLAEEPVVAEQDRLVL
eukprot:m.359414 g.359414  ORF g.359414 m.359414 type:complete len:668 (-) comp18553_c0_seq1:267-2270(-)